MQEAKTRAVRVTAIERACVELVGRHGWTEREVAVIFGCSPEVVARRLQAAAEKNEELLRAA